MTDQQFNKLPKFAQQEITQLRTQLANAINELRSIGDKTPTRIRWFVGIHQ
jgi:transcription elongation GreA/GreB family factor